MGSGQMTSSKTADLGMMLMNLNTQTAEMDLILRNLMDL